MSESQLVMEPWIDFSESVPISSFVWGKDCNAECRLLTIDHGGALDAAWARCNYLGC